MMQPNRSTAAADEHRSSDARHQAMIFGSGHRLSREAYDDLSGPHALSGVTFFQALMHTALALEEQRAGLLSAVSRTVPPSPVELLRHWLDLHALGHLVLLAFRDDRAWFANMLREVGVTRWTPTHALIRERVMSIAVRGAWAVGELGEIGLQLYLPLLRSPVQPLEHFDAVLALAMVALRRSEFRPVVRSAVDRWASRATDAWGLRSELANSVALLLDDPHAASVWALEWCRRVLSRTGATNAAPLPEQASGLGMSEDDLLILAGLNDAGDCAVAVEDLFPAVLLLSQVVGRTAREFYAPQALIPALTKPWTVEVGVDVLRRSIPHVGVSGSTSLN